MNSNELADLLAECIKDGSTDLVCVEQAATMLRQQQAEIKALKEALIVEEESYILLDEECLFAKEAIKLHQAEIEALKQIIDANNLSQNIGQFVKPAKTLTDEEILDVENRLRNNGDFCELHFAKAILRKAQEK